LCRGKGNINCGDVGLPVAAGTLAQPHGDWTIASSSAALDALDAMVASRQTGGQSVMRRSSARNVKISKGGK
jgi:hypothetical protein